MELEWYRSWPAEYDWSTHELNDRPHVIDNLPRLIMSGYEYKTVADYQPWPNRDPGFCMLEWDVALDPWGQRAFAAEALCEPNAVLVAPYRYHGSWCMFIGNDGSGPSETSRQVALTDETCDSFGVGCIYIPRPVLTEFLGQCASFSDATFGKWYRQRYGPARLTWRVHPQHLHVYPPS